MRVLVGTEHRALLVAGHRRWLLVWPRLMMDAASASGCKARGRGRGKGRPVDCRWGQGKGQWGQALATSTLPAGADVCSASCYRATGRAKGYGKARSQASSGAAYVPLPRSSAGPSGVSYSQQLASWFSSRGVLGRLQRDGYAVFPRLLADGDRLALLQKVEMNLDSLADRKFYKSWSAPGGQELRPRTVIMERLGFGTGRYTYLKDPLPEPMDEIRDALYRALAAAANRDIQRHRREVAPKPFAVEQYPPELEEFHDLCRAATPAQTIPTCLALQYRAGGHNLPHRDIYGGVSFPFQALTVLTTPDIDFAGGAFFMQRRKVPDSSRHIVELGPGDLLVFQSTKWHGSEEVLWGLRVAFGLQFHLSST